MKNFIIDNYITILPLSLSIFALILAILVPRRILTNQLFFDLVKEYSSTEFNDALNKLWSIYYNIDFENSNELIDRLIISAKIIVPLYINDFNNSKKSNFNNSDISLHNSRRIVSHFYQKLAFLKFYGFPKVTKRRIRKYFDVTNFKLIELLIPIEIIALPYLLDMNLRDIVHTKDKYLYKLLSKSYKWSYFWEKYKIGYLSKEKYSSMTGLDIQKLFNEIINKK